MALLSLQKKSRQLWTIRPTLIISNATASPVEPNAAATRRREERQTAKRSTKTNRHSAPSPRPKPNTGIAHLPTQMSTQERVPFFGLKIWTGKWPRKRRPPNSHENGTVFWAPRPQPQQQGPHHAVLKTGPFFGRDFRTHQTWKNKGATQGAKSARD